MSRGIDSAYQLLMREAESVQYFERRLHEAQRLRNLLIVKLARAGQSTREIRDVCGMSSPGVSWVIRRAPRDAKET